MCVVKTPKVASPAQTDAAQKDPAILRNVYFDTVNPLTLDRTRGRSSLRIDRGSAPPTTSPLALTRQSLPRTGLAGLPGGTGLSASQRAAIAAGLPGGGLVGSALRNSIGP